MSCPKCGWQNYQPTYHRSLSGVRPSDGALCLDGDHLHYRCTRCGYTAVTRTKDWTAKSGDEDLEPLRK